VNHGDDIKRIICERFLNLDPPDVQPPGGEPALMTSALSVAGGVGETGG
jgi:hypothetical protein